EECARLRPRLLMIRGRLPAVAVERNREDDARRRPDLERVEIGAVVTVLVEEGFFRGRKILQIALDRGEIGFVLRRPELGDRHRGENADDYHHDQELDQRKAEAAGGWHLGYGRHRPGKGRN